MQPSELASSSSSGDGSTNSCSKPLSKRWAAWASNLLVSGVILILGIVFAREVIQWWRADEASSADLPSTAVVGQAQMFADGAGQLLEFGDFPFTLHRSELNGNVDVVLAHLRATCASVLQDGSQIDSEFTPAEQRMLAATAKLQPVADSPDYSSIYQLQAPLPMVVGVREPSPRVADAKRRVVSWGMAFPVEREGESGGLSWTLFTYAIGSSNSDTSSELTMPTPSFGRRTLSLRTDGGGIIAGYVGNGGPREWTMFYDNWLEKQAWHAETQWHVEDTSWRRVFTHDVHGTIDVLLVAGERPTMRAIAVHTPKVSAASRADLGN